ncbi:MAG: MJ0042-type zinc finger domain-containing protein [Beijerinckiaceae bacterium]
MAAHETILFNCPNCGAAYKIVRVRSPAARERQITCLNCGGPLHGRRGGFVLKYFLVPSGKPPRKPK